MELLLGHLVGDYLLQTDWMGNTKKTNSWACAAHVLIYSSVVQLFMWWPWWAFPITFVTHYAIDRTWVIAWYIKKMRMKRFLEPPLLPWAYIIVDNTFHLLTLYGTLKLVEWVGT